MKTTCSPGKSDSMTTNDIMTVNIGIFPGIAKEEKEMKGKKSFRKTRERTGNMIGGRQ